MKGIIRYVDINRLRPHERTEPGKLRQIVRELSAGRAGMRPIVIDRATCIILDGHHRHLAARRMGIRMVPCYLVDYSDPSIRVHLRRGEIRDKLIKQAVMSLAGMGKRFPNKTTKHMIPDRPTKKFRINRDI